LALSAAVLVTLLAVGAAFAQQGTDPQTLENGARLYAENCAVCHGDQGQGRIGATLAKNWPSIRPDLTIKTIIINGVLGSPMPAWGETKGGPLSDAEINALVAYILSWQTGTPVPLPTLDLKPLPQITPIPGVEGDPTQGAALYQLNCKVCHGEDGQGRIGATLAKNWPGIRPDLSIKTTISSGVPGSWMPAWSQEKGGPLNETDINNLTAYILSLPAISSGTPVAQPTTAPEPPGRLASAVSVILLVIISFGAVAVMIWVQRRNAG
jgi:mono/diheme cytochrome c family protein